MSTILLQRSLFEVRIVRLSGYMGLIIGSFILALWVRTARAEGIDTPYFHVSEQDRIRYRVTAYERGQTLYMLTKAGLVNPEGATRGEILPEGITVREGKYPLKDYTAAGNITYCDGLLTNDLRHSYPSPGSFFDAGILADSRILQQYVYFVARDSMWSGRCWLAAHTCIVIFSNENWSSRLNISQRDLCRAPSMNQRVGQIVKKWVKK
jgi:hypothetical protein